MEMSPVQNRTHRSLHRQPDFLKLWLGQGLSAVGSEVTEVALPLTAVMFLHASAGEMGLLNMARWLPFLLFALIMGVYADRLRRLPLLVTADAGRALVLAGIVVAAWAGVLGMPMFVVLVFVFGTLTVLFEVSYFAYVPSLVDRGLLVPANSRLQATASVARVGGPAIGGGLVQLMTAPYALLVDAISFVASVAGLLLIRTRERERPVPEPGEGIAERIRQGLRITYRNPFLRALVGVAASYNFFDDWILTLWVLYAVRDLGMRPGAIGLVMAGGAVGAVIGSAGTGPFTRRLGLGGALVGSVVLESIVLLAVPLTPGHHLFTIPVITLAFALNGVGVALSSVAAVSVRQSVTPDELLGRMTASYRFISYGAVPLGAAVGGVVGQFAGVRTGLLLGAIGMVSTIAWVVLSPLPGLRTVEDAESHAEGVRDQSEAAGPDAPPATGPEAVPDAGS